MACVDVGKMRAYCDGELASAEVAMIEGHITACAGCKTRLDDIKQTGIMVSAKLSTLAPSDGEAAPGVAASLAALQRKTEKRNGGGIASAWAGSLRAWANYQWRVSLAGLAVVALVAALVALPPVRSMAGELLGIFRVQKFTPVAVDPGTMANLPMLDPRLMGTLEGISQMPALTAGLTPAQAAAKVDFPVRLPAQLPPGVVNEPKLSALEAFSAGYTFDRAKAQAYLESLGLKGINLPKTPDGRKITASVPARLFAEYGSGGTGPTLMVIEGRSPALEIPAGVDAEEVRNTILSFPGLPPELVVQLRTLDWQTTAPVPVLKGDTSKQVIVDGGAEGLLIQSAYTGTALLWQKQDVVYILAGRASEAELIAAANSMR